MTVNQEVKGQLARLLATEDLVVEHKKCETAQFNVHTRVLTLPMWEKASNTVYDLLVGHEVGHALYTPDEDWSEQCKVPLQFVNVVEDARIEKLMKRRYAGLAKTFFNGYKELAEEDFFQLENENVQEMNLADRANLYFKIGNFLSLKFNQEEQDIISLIDKSETFAEVLEAAEVLYNYCKKKKEEETKIELDSRNYQSGFSNESSSDLDDQQSGENDQQEQPGETDSYGGTAEQEKQTISMGGETDNPEVKTIEALEEALKELVNNNGYENTYLEIPKIDIDSLIVKNFDVHESCRISWNVYNDPEYNSINAFEESDQEYRDFKHSAQKEVNYLVKEFECRKAADSYARASTARTGVLDCSKLHTYKYNEDLFKKVTTLADGKNHGLIFILDWSGSMQDVMLDTVKQLFNLVWFCRKVNIPFEVYAFTYDYPRVRYDENHNAIMPKQPYEKRDGVVAMPEWFSLMNILTSKVNTRTLEEQMINIFRIARSFRRGCYSRYSTPLGWSLSGTPLNESLICLHEILPKFQQDNKLQKVQCVILTDGEASPLKYHKEVQRRWESEPYIGSIGINPYNSFLRDRKTGFTYSLNVEWYNFSDVLLRNLRDRFPSVNFIGIRVLESRDAGTFIRRYYGNSLKECDQTIASWKKEKTFSIKSSGYHKYFGISATALGNETEFDVSEDASKAQIKSAFAKSLKSKKLNKKVLGEFVELVA